MDSGKQALRLLALIGALLVFSLSLELMVHSFARMGRGVAEGLVATTANPLVGLFLGILATAIVQSSSTTTSVIVALVAGGGLSMPAAIPIILGANIGTTVTNNIVALGHITRRLEFRRAIGGATVHDFFNIVSVAVLFPLELAFGIISRPAEWLSAAVTGIGGAKFLSPVALVIEPVAGWVIEVSRGSIWVIAPIGLVLVFLSIRLLVYVLSGLVVERVERVLQRFVFGSPVRSFLIGLALTVLVQSSSLTTSLVVPLAAAGLVGVSQLFPYVMGANIGTTVTALLAALLLAAGGAAVAPAALPVAFAHLLFNVFGVTLLTLVRPLSAFSVWLAEGIGQMAERNRAVAPGYLLLIFFLIPLLVLLVARVF